MRGRIFYAAFCFFSIASIAGGEPLGAQEAARQPAVDLHGDPLPEGAVARLGTLRYRHEAIFGQKPFGLLPDDQTLMITSERTVSLWDLATGIRRKQLDFHPLNISGGAVSPDAALLAVAGYAYRDPQQPATGEVRVIDLASGATVRNLERKESREVDHATLAFSPDGKLLLSAASTGVFRVEEIATGGELLAHQFPRDVNPGFVLSPDGKMIAYASGANTQKVFCWDWKSGDEPLELKLDGAERRPERLGFSPDGKLLVIADDLVHPPEIWDVRSQQLVMRLLFPVGEQISADTVSFTPDGKSVVLSGMKPPREPVAHVWDAATGEHRQMIEGLGRHVVSSDSKRLIGVNPMGVWSLETGKQMLPTEDHGHTGDLNTVAFLKSGEILTAGRDDGTIRIWDPKTMRQKLKLRSHRWPVVAASPDGRWIVSAGHDNRVRLWDAETGRKVFDLPGHGRVGGRYTVTFDHESQRFYSFGDDFHTRTWDISTGKALADSKLAPVGLEIPDEDDDRELKPDLSFTQSCYSPDGKVLYVSFGKRIHRFDSANGKELSSFELRFSWITSLASSADGDCLVLSGLANQKQIPLPNGQVRHISGTDRTVLLLNAETGEELQSIVTPNGHSGIAALSPDGKLIADATLHESANTLAIHDSETGQLKHSLKLPSRPSIVRFSPDGQSIATSHMDGTVLVWDLSKLSDSAQQ